MRRLAVRPFRKLVKYRGKVFRCKLVEAVCSGQVTVRRSRGFQGDSEPSFCLEIHVSAGRSLGRYTWPQQ